MIECPCCENETEGPVCEVCDIALPVDWMQSCAMVHTAGPSEKPHREYDPYEDELRDHLQNCACITCINLKGWPDYASPLGPSFERTQREYHGVIDPDNPEYENGD